MRFLPKVFNPLMVHAVDVEARFAVDLFENALLSTRDFVIDVVVFLGMAVFDRRLCLEREVLIELTAKVDVDELKSPANSKNGFVILKRPI